MSEEVKISTKMVGHFLLIRPDPVKKKHGMIELAIDEKLERGATTSGIVLDIGPEAFLAFQQAAGIPLDARHPWVETGQHIYYSKYAGKWIDDASTNEPLLIIRDEDVVGLV